MRRETESVRQKATERRTRGREGEKQGGMRERVGLEGPQSRKRPLLHGSALMGLARPSLCSQCWSASQN